MRCMSWGVLNMGSGACLSGAGAAGEETLWEGTRGKGLEWACRC